MQIETTGDPVCQRPYRAALTKRQVIETEIDQMLRDGVIEPSSSPWASPVTLVLKRGGEWRFCVDYRTLNERTKKDRFPLPHVQDVFDNAGKGRICSTLDLKSGYWQLPVAAEDQEKTAFICHRGQFAYKRVSFELANVPAHFQHTMSRVLAPSMPPPPRGRQSKAMYTYFDIFFDDDKKEIEVSKYIYYMHLHDFTDISP